MNVYQLVIPWSGALQQLLLQELHNTSYSAHLGGQKTTSALLEQVWWPYLAVDVKHFCKLHRAPLHPYTHAKMPKRSTVLYPQCCTYDPLQVRQQICNPDTGPRCLTLPTKLWAHRENKVKCL